MDLSDKAEAAVKRGDHRAAARFYRAMAIAVPDRSIGFIKACASYEAAGDWSNAIDNCRAALGRPGVTVNDYGHFVRLLLAKPALESDDTKDIEAILSHLQAEGVERGIVDELQCDFGMKVGDTRRLESCTAALTQRAPNDPRTISYQWALALLHQDYAEARRLVEHAKATPMSPDSVRGMEEATSLAEPWWSRNLTAGRLSAGLVLVLGTGIALMLARKRRPVVRPGRP
jgi:hypothetical protein